MKNILFKILLLINFPLCAQSFLPFNSSSHKLYRDDFGNTHSLTFQLASANQIDSVFIPTLNVDQAFFNSDSCMFWGGNVCHQQNLPGWLGKKVKTNNFGNYTFYKVNGDSLGFVFNANSSDTNLIFQNNTEILRMSFANTASVQIFGFTDSVNYYNLYHTDINGNPINSVLNQFQLAVGKQLGLISFLKIDSFPNQIITLNLLGNQQPNIGIHAITNEMVNDFSIGDEYQWHEFSGWAMWATNVYNRFIKNTILNKTITNDSIIYLIQKITLDLTNTTQVIDTINYRFPRNQILGGIPFEIFDGLNYKILKEVEICGNNYWELTSINEPYNFAFCAVDTCWGSVDTQGPAPSITRKITLGLGQKLFDDYLSGGGLFSTHHIRSELIYFKKNGQVCGVEQIVGDANHFSNTVGLKIAPNPANQELYLNYIVAEKGATVRFSVINLQGQIILEKIVANNLNFSNTTIMDVSVIPSGFYYLNFEQNGKLIQSNKFVKN